MQKIIVFLVLIFLHGCSFNNPFSHREIDKVTVVKYTPHMKHHRAFLSRSNLKILKNGKKYLYLYHKRYNDLAVLVKRNNTFLLYTLSNPKQDIYSLHVRQNKNYNYALKHFKKMGYRTLTSTSKKGFLLTVSRKRYKGVKTLLFDIKDYTHLLKLYKKSIRTYNANRIRNIKTTLPKSLILPYYKYYEKKARYKKQHQQLNIIANKLKIKGFKSAKETTQVSGTKIQDSEENTKEAIKKQIESSWYDFNSGETKEEVINEVVPPKEETKEIVTLEEKQIPQKKKALLPYGYYLNQASEPELRNYLLKETSKQSLSASKYLALQQRKRRIEEKRLLKEGTLDELISAYKRNNKPEFKQRILSLMKEKQQ